MKILDEDAVQYLEGLIPEIAEAAVLEAKRKALASGRAVVEAVNGEIIEHFSDGSSKGLKKISRPVPVKPGLMKIRRKQ